MSKDLRRVVVSAAVMLVACSFSGSLVSKATKAEQVSTAAKVGSDLWLGVKNSEWGTLDAAASGNWQEAWQQSETCRWLATYMVEAMVAINNEYQESSPFKRGEIKGRVTIEVILIILPFTKAAEATKVSVLTKLTEIQWIRENQQLLNILSRSWIWQRETNPCHRSSVFPPLR